MTGWRGVTSRTRLMVVAVIGIVVAVVVALAGDWRYAPGAGWDAAALVLLVWTWLAIAPMDSADTESHATRENPSRAATDALLLGATVASLAAVGFVVIEANSAKGATAGLLAGFAVLSVALSWAVVHTLFTLRYALLYYGGNQGGIDFNQKARPRYVDFAYLAFTIGMTYQVSDTDLQTHPIRATALRHGLLSFLFGTVVVATTINLVVSLSSGG